MQILIKNGTIITLGSPNKVLGGDDLLIEDERILMIGRNLDPLLKPGCKTIDASEKIVMPGLINAHHHFYSSFARGLTKVEPSGNFLEILHNLWWRLDRKLSRDDIYYSALVSLIEAIRHGTTTIFDHHAGPATIPSSLDLIADAVIETGLRGSLCYEVSDRDGSEVATAGIAENSRFIDRCRKGNDDRLRALFGVHAAFTVSDETLDRCVAAARDGGVGLHIHIAEDLADQKYCLEHHGCRVVERLDRMGGLLDGSLFAHGVHLDDHEMELLSDKEVFLAHNAQSNMNNAVGVADVPAMLARGMKVGLGTDAMTMNMGEELRGALFVQKLTKGQPWGFFPETADLLLKGNPAFAGKFWPGIGTLFVGAPADLIVVEYNPPTPLSADNFYAHFVFGISQAVVDTTIVAGKVLMEKKKLLTIEEEAVAQEARRLAGELWDRF